MSEKLHPTPTDGRCTVCGDDHLTIATDVTEYHKARFDESTGKWARGSHQQTDPQDYTRLFCSGCGAYFEVPDLED